MSGRRLMVASVAAAAPVTPLTIFQSVPVLLWVRGDKLITNVAGVATAWGDSSGAGHNMVPTVVGPVITAADASLNNLQTLRFNAAQTMKTPLVQALPFTYCGIFKPVTYNGTAAIACDDNAANAGQVAYAGGSPNIYLNNGGYQDNVAATMGAWARLRARFHGTIADELKLGSAAVGTGTSAGANSLSTVCFNSGAQAAGLGVFDLFEFVVLGGDATVPEYAAYDAYVTSVTGGAAAV